MDFFAINIRFLKKNSIALYNAISQEEAVTQTQVEAIPESNNLLVQTATGKCYLHSAFDREREHKKLFQTVDPNVRLLILMGIGLGESLPYLAKHYSQLEHLIIIEPSVGIFRAFLREHDIQKVLGIFPKVSIVLNQPPQQAAASLSVILSSEKYRQFEYVSSVSYRTLYDEYYNQIYRVLLDYIRTSRVNVNTRDVFGRMWLVNCWRNRKRPAIPLEYLLTHVASYPAIIVSAGPSLNKNIHLLQQAKDRAMIVAVGSAMTILESYGIVPHFRIAIDGGKGNEALFNKVNSSTVPLIFSDSLYYGVLPNYLGPKIRMTLSSDEVGLYLTRQETLSLISIRSGFSVANVAMDLLGKWQCEKIILLGQDLCYTNERLHADGAWDDDQEHPKGNIKMQDIYGNEVYTSQPFLGMKAQFEELITAHPSSKVINATEGGLPIKGAANKSFEQVLKEDLTETLYVSEKITKALEAYPSKEVESVSVNTIQKIESQLKEILAINEDILERIEKVLALFDNNVSYDRIMEQIRRIEKQFHKIRKKDLYSQVLSRLLNDKFHAIRLGFEYNGRDLVTSAKMQTRILAGEAVELKEYALFIQMLLEEYKGTRSLNIKFE